MNYCCIILFEKENRNMEKLQPTLVVIKKILIVALGLIKKGLLQFWKFMVKPNKKNKVSKWKFIALALILVIAHHRVRSYLDRPVVADKGAESVAFTANGDYLEGQDIKSGTYYILLTKFSGDSPVWLEIGSGKYRYHFEDYDTVGAVERVAIPKGSVLEIEGADNDYEISFFTEEDYLTKRIKEKYPVQVKKSSSSSSASLSSSASSVVSSSIQSSSSSVTEMTTSSSSVVVSPSMVPSTPDLNEYASFLQELINGSVSDYQVSVYQKEGGFLHIVFPQDIKYESKEQLQAFADALLEVHRGAFYTWVDDNGFELTNSATDVPVLYMDAEDGTRVAEYSILSGTMKVKIKN